MNRPIGPDDAAWQILNEKERRQVFHEYQQWLIAQHGFTCIGVFPTQDDPLDYHFAYTVGGDTSIIVTGVSSVAEPLLTLGWRRWQDQTETVGVPFVVSEDYYSVFAPVADEAFRAHCKNAIVHGAERAVQLVWQQDDHTWPWDNDNDPPILAGADWRPT